MGSLLINFTPSTDNTAQSYRVKYKIKGSVSYNTVNPEPVTSPVTIPDIDTSYGYEGTIESDCGYGIYSIPLNFSTNSLTSSLSVLDVWYQACNGCVASIGTYFTSITITKQGDSVATYSYNVDNSNAQKSKALPNLIAGSVYVVSATASTNSSSKGISAYFYSAPGVNATVGVDNNNLNKSFTFVATSSNNNINLALSSKGPNCECQTTSQPIGCFKAGTSVTLSEGLQKPIEQLVVGDKILSVDHNQHLVNSEVVTTLSYFNQPVYLKLDNQILTTTADHLFLTSDGYKRADQLKLNTEIYILEGKKLKPKTILESYTVNEKIKVYNITAEPYHTFFADRVVVHD